MDEIRVIRVNIVWTKHDKIIIRIGSRNRVRKPERFFLVSNLNSEIKFTIFSPRCPTTTIMRDTPIDFSVSIDRSSNVRPSTSINAFGIEAPSSPILVALPAAGITPMRPMLRPYDLQ